MIGFLIFMAPVLSAFVWAAFTVAEAFCRFEPIEGACGCAHPAGGSVECSDCGHPGFYHSPVEGGCVWVDG